MAARAPGLHYYFVWVLNGTLVLVEGDERHELRAGDCIQLSPPTECIYINPTKNPCIYATASLNQVA